MVPIEPLRAWMTPGSRAVVEYADDRHSHERVFLYPVDRYRWLVTTADADTYEDLLRQGRCQTDGVQTKDAWKCCGCRRQMQNKYFSPCDACWHQACDACITSVIYNGHDYWLCPCCPWRDFVGESMQTEPTAHSEDAGVDPNARLQQENRTEATIHDDVHRLLRSLTSNGTNSHKRSGECKPVDVSTNSKDSRRVQLRERRRQPAKQ